MTSIDHGAAPITAVRATFRTCRFSGLRIESSAEALIKANAVAAVLFLMLGGLMGLLVALTRWPAVQLLPADMFYLVLTGHGANVLLFWIIFFEIAVLYFASAVILGSRIAAPKMVMTARAGRCWGWGGLGGPGWRPDTDPCWTGAPRAGR